MVINLITGLFDLKPVRPFPLVPQTWLVNPVIYHRAHGYCISTDIQQNTDAE
jgi:hypothetical protein